MKNVSVILLQIGLPTGFVVLREEEKNHVFQLFVDFWVPMTDECGNMFVYILPRIGYQGSTMNRDSNRLGF